MFLGLPDQHLDPFVRAMDPDPAPDTKVSWIRNTAVDT
jgi:hypothetical protein